MTTEQTLRETFIEAAARTIYDIASPPRSRCGWCAHDATQTVEHPEYLKLERIASHLFEPRRPEEIATEATPQTYRLYAAQLYGAVTALNGPMVEIVKAAHDATGCEFEPSNITHQCHSDLGTLFRAITIESLGGAKVSETFGEVTLLACSYIDPIRGAQCIRRGDVHLVHWIPAEQGSYVSARGVLEVPRLTIEGAQT